MAKTGKAAKPAKKQVKKTPKKTIAKKPAKAKKAATKGPKFGPASFRQIRMFKNQGDYFQLNKKYADK